MARYILKAPRNTPSVALYGDLGWNPISSTHNLQRVKYLARLSNMDLHRWPKLMLNAVMNVNCDIDMIRYKWFSSVSNVLYKRNRICMLRKCSLCYCIGISRSRSHAGISMATQVTSAG